MDLQEVLTVSYKDYKRANAQNRLPDKPICVRGEFEEKIWRFIYSNYLERGIRTPQVEVIKHFLYNDPKSILRAITVLVEEGKIKKYKDDMRAKEVVTFRKCKMIRNVTVLEVVEDGE